MRKVFHFLGKGGVGKTTSSALQAILLSKKGKTLLVSLDPAHNLSDVLGIEIGEEPKEVSENLYAMEPNIAKLMESYTKEVVSEIESHYKYLKVLNLDKLLKIIEYTPGVEEQVILEEIAKLMNLEYDYIVIDHAPTGLSVRVLLLPQVLLTWLEQLRELRLQILKRREILGQRTAEDKVLELLNSEIDKYKEIDSILKDPNKSAVIIVLNPEEMPCLEASRIKDVLTNFNLPLCGVIVNKTIEGNPVDETLINMKREQAKWLEFIEKEFKGLKIIKIPYIAPPPRGLDNLEELAKGRLGEPLCWP